MFRPKGATYTVALVGTASTYRSLGGTNLRPLMVAIYRTATQP